MEENILFVFGAGFTYDFTDGNIPLLISDWGLGLLEADYNRKGEKKDLFKYKIIKYFQEERGYNIESMLTRLNIDTPSYNEINEIKIKELYSEILEIYINKIKDVSDIYWNNIKDIKKIYNNNLEKLNDKQKLIYKLALYCKENKINCITLNIDTIFDEILYKTNGDWHPDIGYGFFCPQIIPNKAMSINIDGIKYLKLHGSINWRTYRSSHCSNDIEQIRHYEDWFVTEEKEGVRNDDNFIEDHLNKDRIVVPPLLSKKDFMSQTIFYTIWKSSSRIISNADKIFFVGYSFPATDYTIRSLFQENVKPECEIIYITRKCPSEKSVEIIKTEKEKLMNIFRGIKEDTIQILPIGASDWVSSLIDGS